MQRMMTALARAMALLGGLVLVSLVILTCLSVLGRIANTLGHSDFVAAAVPFLTSPLRALGPINGDYELIEAGIAFAIFAFLPWCQIVRGNVMVDFFMSAAPTRSRLLADIMGGLIYLLISALLTWRMIFGGIDMYNYNELSMTINFPRWTTFPISIAMMAFLTVVIIYTIGRSIAEMRAGRYFDEPVDAGDAG